MTLIIDPDNLNQNTEVVIDTSGKTIQLLVAGNLSTDGVTLKCLYSFLKEEWKNDSSLVKFPFPMGPITDEQFELINGWDFKDNTTRYLIRSGGWALKDSGGISLEEWAGIISLGSIGASDQAYFQQVASGSATNLQLTGAVNQAVKVYGDGSHGNFDYRSYFKIFVREQGKVYATAQLSDIGVTIMTYQVYRFPLANSSDTKITTTDANIIGNTPYFGTSTATGTDGSTGIGDPTFTSASANFTNGDIGKYICIDSGDNKGFYKIISRADANNVDVEMNFPATGSSITYTICPVGMSITWYAVAQQRSIGGVNRDFHIIVDANNGTAEQVYEFVQYQLRQNNDIDAGAGTKTGKVNDDILRFVGDTLYTLVQSAGGVFIDNYQDTDVNRLVMVDDLSVNRTFPYVAILTLNFGDNLVADESSKYWVFFTNDDAGSNLGYDYGTADAIIVEDDDSADMTGLIDGESTITHTFAYDSNTQRGAGSDGEDAPITVVAIGLDTAQFVKATGTITRSTANTISLVAALERNYSNE